VALFGRYPRSSPPAVITLGNVFRSLEGEHSFQLPGHWPTTSAFRRKYVTFKGFSNFRPFGFLITN